MLILFNEGKWTAKGAKDIQDDAHKMYDLYIKILGTNTHGELEIRDRWWDLVHKVAEIQKTPSTPPAPPGEIWSSLGHIM